MAGHQGKETKNTGISEHIGKNTIKIINEIQFFTYHINKNKKTTTLKMARLEKRRVFLKTKIDITFLTVV